MAKTLDMAVRISGDWVSIDYDGDDQGQPFINMNLKLWNAVLDYVLEHPELQTPRIKNLVARNKRLSALETGGVDNWEWYHESLKYGGCLGDDD